MKPVARHRIPFAVIVLLVVVAGYLFGKDMAMRANAQDRAEAATLG